MKPKAVVLLSGGLDSAVTLYMAVKEGYECHCLIFDYGQRHREEIKQARLIAASVGAKAHVMKLALPAEGSSLTDKSRKLPAGRSAGRIEKSGIPSTYVPARNTVFLSIAASFAETIGASAIFIGAHRIDSSGYPDCRAEYLEAFHEVIRLGTRAGTENRLKLEFPLIKKGKKDIILTGNALGVPFELTRSCYNSAKKPCGECDSCILRAKGFEEAGMKDKAL